MLVAVAVVLAGICWWISRWDLRRPEAHAARARYPYARPRPSVQRLLVMGLAALAVCLLSLAALPHLEMFRFP